MVLIKSVFPITFGWLYVTFDNGEQKIVDIKPYMYGVLEKLKDPDFFKEVFVDPELETVSWPGELDLDPDKLYKQGINVDIIKEVLNEKLDDEIIYNQNEKKERA